MTLKKKPPADDGLADETGLRRSPRKEQPTPKALLLAKAKQKAKRRPIRRHSLEKGEGQGMHYID